MSSPKASWHVTIEQKRVWQRFAIQSGSVIGSMFNFNSEEAKSEELATMHPAPPV